MTTAYALYRLPLSDTYIEVAQTSGEPEELSACSQLNGRRGFVMAPFAISADEPLLLIRADRTVTHCLEAETEVAGCAAHTPTSDTSDRKQYAADFSLYHNRLTSGEFSKIVLARRTGERMRKQVSPRQLFLRACRLYPRMFVALVSTKRGGTWLTATPEMLLCGGVGLWHTVALAGTMRLEGDSLSFDNPPSRGGMPAESMSWNAKNIQEQRYVATYIAEKLGQTARDVIETPPHTVRAGGVVHLRSDFTFTIDASRGPGDVLDALHPTPAVCGLPEYETYRFIAANEHSPRSYYSGFMGPLCSDAGTHLYVSLRCMRICGDRCRLYAGGGLLADSTEQQEWAETEAKMETMRKVLDGAT